MTCWPRPAALLGIALLASQVGAVEGPDPSRAAALSLLEPAVEASDASESVWPDWDIAAIPLLLLENDESCLLIHHLRPPGGYRRLRHDADVSLSVYQGEAGEHAPPLSDVGRATTAVVTWRELFAAGPGLVYERAFIAYEADLCPDAVEPFDLIAAYPVGARNLVLSDIECEILAAAAEALDSGAVPAVVESLARELVCIRTYRRIQVGPRFAEYERRLELGEGVPRYVAGSMVERTARRSFNPVFDEAVASCRERLGEGLGDRPWCADPGTDLDWYRERRFRYCGAAICRMLDATVPGWKERVANDCEDPYSILEERFRLEAPRPSHVTPRYDFETRLAERAAFVEDVMTSGEKRFMELTRGDSLRFCINTHLLAHVSVSFERDSMTEVDRHRQVHERILRLEFSGKTRLDLVGRPAAVIVENDAFDVRQVILPAPEEYTVTAGGRVIDLTNGIHEIDEPHRVEARGFLLEAERTVVFVSDERITFVIHR
jgi:hypothetical protein